MKRLDRFFVADLAALTVGETMRLDPREAVHATRVKRHRTGDHIELFDGHGLVARAAVTAAEPRRGVTVRLTEAESVAPPVGELCWPARCRAVIAWKRWSRRPVNSASPGLRRSSSNAARPARGAGPSAGSGSRSRRASSAVAITCR
ncbi:MAG: hypothetical protein M5U09_16080 [Gammaproteobacteria bacterium]|nr:hypothetical protein [Gammaproteobacteria bacterium]